MRVHVTLKLLGTVLLVAAVTVLSLQVHVGGSGASGRSCGSSLDVLTDRAGWETWYAQDIVDAPEGSQLLRTLDCPHAVNARSVIAGVLGAAGIAAIAGAVMLQLASAGVTKPRGVASPARLRRLGKAVTAVGAVLTVAGLVALALLLADRDSTLFIYVTRPVVAALGLVVLAPVLALLIGGRALTILARWVEDREGGDETG